MSLQEKVLMRKIKNREKKKKQFLKLREEQNQLSEHVNTKSDRENIPKNELTSSADDKKRKSDQNSTGSLKSIKEKKKKKKEENDVEENIHFAANGNDTTSLEQDTKTPDDNISKPEKNKKKSNPTGEIISSCEDNSASSLDIPGIKKKKKKKKKVNDVEENIHFAANGNESTSLETTDDTSKLIMAEPLKLELSKDALFSTLEGRVSSKTLKAVAEMGFTKMTAIQAKAILQLLHGKDYVVSDKTGSGKTLAFLIPAVELIYKLEFKSRNGTGCLIISPTRELAMQTFGVLKGLMAHHRLTYGLIMGGANRKTEAEKLSNGINILVATPGRLLDHMRNTRWFMTKNLMCLVIDEVDRLLHIGFEEDIKQIINLLPKRRQTMLFTATTSSRTEALTKFVLKRTPLHVSVDDNTEQATVEGLNQGYVICPSEKRFLLLFSSLRKYREKKVMVFFSSCLSVQFHHDLFNYIDLNCMCIHGKQKQTKRTTTFFQFSNASSGILLCTDVAARGLDIPNVDWIIQYDPPDDPKDYIHRVGRTARGLGGCGNAMLILQPEELGFLRYLKQARVPLNEYGFFWDRVNDIQPELERLIGENFFLNKSAKEAFKAYVRAYESHRLKLTFNVAKLDLAAVAKSFGLIVPPAIDLQVSNIRNSQPYKRKGGGSFGFNNINKDINPHKSKKYIQPKR